MSRTHEWAKRWDILFNKRNKFHISKESYVLFCLLPHNNRAINCKAFHDSGENINETLFYIIIVFICTCNKWELELIKINETLRCISILYKWSLFAPPRPALPDLLYFFLRGGGGGGGMLPCWASYEFRLLFSNRLNLSNRTEHAWLQQ